MSVRVTAIGAMTSVGVGAVQTDASLRAGLCRFREGPWVPGDEPVTMALVRDEFLGEAMAQARGVRGLDDGWALRLVALGALALGDALAAVDRRAPIVVLLGLPDAREGLAPPAAPLLFAGLAAASGVAIDTARSAVFPRGRAAIFDALAMARALLEREPQLQVVCGAIDSYADPRRVAREHADVRTVGAPYAGDGRVLGEGAGMLVLDGDPQRRGGMVIAGLGRVDDPGHRFGSAPARGEGLAQAIEALRAEFEPPVPFATVWAGLVGEVHDAKLWGTACLRHRDRLLANTRVEHPADRLGDAGAGLGALLLVDAYARLVAGRRDGPALVWTVSDHGPCGCAAVELDTPGARR